MIIYSSPSNFTCPDSSRAVNCECQARSALRWTVTSQVTGEELLRVTYGSISFIGVVTSPNMNGYTVVLCSVDTSGTISLFTSKLNFTFTENVSVTCEGISTAIATLQTAGEKLMNEYKQPLFRSPVSTQITKIGCLYFAVNITWHRGIELVRWQGEVMV